MAGLLDWMQTPVGMGLLSAVAGGMAGARKGTPWNNVGRGLVTGVQGYAGAQDMIRQEQENAFAKQFKTLQMQELESKIAQQKAMKEAGVAAASKAMVPGSHGPLGYKPTDPNAFIGQFAQGGTTEDDAFNQANMQAIASGNNALAPEPESQFDQAAYQNSMVQELAQRGLYDEAMKYAPKPDDMQLVTVYENGQGVQKWIPKGKADGVTVGLSKPDNSPLGALIAERNALPEGHPARALYDQAIEKAATHAPAAQMNNYGSPVAGVGLDGKPVFFQPSKGGGAPSIVQGVVPIPPTPKPFTETENSSTGFLGRMQAAEKILGGLQGAEPTVYTSAAGSVPFVGDYVQQKAMTPQQQQYKQAADDWIRAKLRKESGAAIPPDEMDQEYKVYFPQPGNSLEVIAQKAQARKMAEAQLMQSAGPAGVAYQARDDARYTQQPFSKSEMDFISEMRAKGVPEYEILRALNSGKHKKTTPAKSSNKPIPMKAPPGVDPKLWQHMTPSERKLWQN